ncbi:MAG: hypothetical protein ACI3WU_04655 [Phascolarctobacterium sp.]
MYSQEEVEIRRLNKKQDYNTFTATELKNLVKAAQCFDQRAIDRLCEAFRPLIIREAHRSYVVGNLGTDAENTAWELFLEFIQRYQGNNFRLLPGLMQKHLYFELLHKVYPEKPTSVQADLVLDETDADGKRRIDIPYNSESFDKLLSSSYLKALLQALTEKQRDIILATVIGDQSLDEYRLQYGISFKVAYLRQQTALAKLKAVIQGI